MNAADTAPFHFQPGARRDVLLLCDHASHLIPPGLDGLGLPEQERLRHIGWDIGAAGLTRRMARLLDAPAYLGGVSRLVVDLNRAPDAADAIVEVSESTAVPGNAGLGELERQRRVVNYHAPYHHAVDLYLSTLEREALRPALVSLHSFTPVYHGHPRPWPVGLLWQRTSPWLKRLFACLRAEGLDVGDNQPYDGSILLGYTLQRHGVERGLPHVLIEVRQDLIAAADGQDAWAQRLTTALLACGLVPATA